MIGDFNQVFSQEEKRGGRPVASSSRDKPGEIINNNGLIDIHFFGNPFTWSNRREALANIKERLDRVFSNDKWRILFPRAAVRHIPTSTSDHSPILLLSEGEDRNIKRPFKFEEAWTRDKSSFFFVVEKAWRQRIHGSPLFKVCSKIKVTKQEFCKWNKQWFGNIQSKIKESWSKLEEIQAKDPMPENVKIEASICLELQEWLKREETLWKKKARTKWHTLAELNTRFFHFVNCYQKEKK